MAVMHAVEDFRDEEESALLCDQCHEPMECYEGELYCPDCTRFGVEEAGRLADDEARRDREREAAMHAEPVDGTEPPW